MQHPAQANTRTLARSSPLEHSSSCCSGRPETKEQIQGHSRVRDAVKATMWCSSGVSHTPWCGILSAGWTCRLFSGPGDHIPAAGEWWACTNGLDRSTSLLLADGSPQRERYLWMQTSTRVERACKGEFRQTRTVCVFSPSSSSVSVSANISRALFSPRSAPVASSRFSSALEASCVRVCESKWHIVAD